MTEIMEILGRKHVNLISSQNKSDWNQNDIAKMQKFLRTNNFQSWTQKSTFFVLMESFHFCRAQFTQLGLFGLLEISKESQHMQFNLNLYNFNGSLIKAASIHQKTGISKLCNIQSSSSSPLYVLCNPLTGEIKFAIGYFITQNDQIDIILENVLITLQQSSNEVTRILEFLELIPPSKNKLIIDVCAKMEKCRIQLLGSHLNQVQSEEQQQHEQLFISHQAEPQIIYSWLTHTKIRLFAEETYQKQKSKLILNPQMVKKSNFVNVEIPQYVKSNLICIQNLLAQRKTIQNDPRCRDQFFISTCQLSNSQKVDLQFSFKNGRKSDEEIDKIQKVSKSNYYKFLRQYICLKNQDQLNKKYIIKKYQQLNSIQSYLLKNRNSMSYQTKLHLCYQLASIGWICQSNIKKFQPSYTSFDVHITQDNSLKIQRIVSAFKDKLPSLQIAQTCYEILYSVKAKYKLEFEEKPKKKKKVAQINHQVKVIDDGQSKYQGVSVINFWLKKILLDIIDFGNNHKKNLMRIQSSTSFESRSFLSEFNRISLDSPRQSHSPFMLGPSASSNTSLFSISSNHSNHSNQNTARNSMQNLQLSSNLQQQISYLQKLLFVLSVAHRTYSDIFNKNTDYFSIDSI